MKFLDTAKLITKFEKSRQVRSEILEAGKGDIHPLFYAMDAYLGTFFQGISDDVNTRDILKVFAKLDEDAFQASQAILVFGYFYIRGRSFEETPLLRQQWVINGFEQVWSITPSSLKRLQNTCDSKEPGMEVLFLWSLIQEVVGNKELSPVFAFIHLNNVFKIITTYTFSSEDYLNLIKDYYIPKNDSDAERMKYLARDADDVDW